MINNKKVLGMVSVLGLSAMVAIPAMADSGLGGIGFTIKAVDEEHENMAMRGHLSSGVTDTPDPEPGTPPATIDASGTMRFVISDPENTEELYCDLPSQSIHVEGVADGSRIISPSGESVELKAGANPVGEAGLWTIEGGFTGFGVEYNSSVNYMDHQVTCLTEVQEWEGTHTTRLDQAFRSTSQLLAINDFPSGVISAQGILSGSYFNQNVDFWDVSNMTDMSHFFSGAGMFNNGAEPGVGVAPIQWDVSHVTDMSLMFNKAQSFNQNISNWDVSNVESMAKMFNSAFSFNNGEAPLYLNTESVDDFFSMFELAYTFNQPTSLVLHNSPNLNSMFRSAHMFNNGSVSMNWDTSRVVDMGNMFHDASAFNNPGVSDWNTSNVIDMSGMFGGAVSFNQSLSSWNMSNVISMSNMFGSVYGAMAFNNGSAPGASDAPLAWNTPRLENTNQMFLSATAFNQPISFNTSEVEYMYGMFNRATSFNQNVSGLDTSSLLSSSNMFNGASAFNNGGEPFSWDTSNVVDMSNMFASASAMRQNISSWDVCNVESSSGFATGVSVSNWPATARPQFGVGC